MLKQRLAFPIKEKTETMDRLAISQSQKISETTLDFPIKEEIGTMDRLAIIEEPKIVETTVRFSS